MDYNIQNIIERLQRLQKEDPNAKLINRKGLVKLLDETYKVNNIRGVIERIETEYKKEEHNKYKFERSNLTETAKIVNVSRVTLNKWIEDGIIETTTYENDYKDKLINILKLLENLKYIARQKGI